LYEGLENQLAHYYLSLCWARLDDKAEASEQMRAFLEELHVWREALELRPATFTRLKLFRQFQFHQERGMYIEEEASLASLLDRFVAGPLTHFYRGTAEYFLGYYQEAVAELEAALNALGQLGSGARSPLTHYYLGLAYKKLNDRAQATSHLEAFLSDPGSDPNVGLRMADARKQLEEIRHAQATGGVSS
jgi:tetratricopeptide (TPR) repeat protein